MYFQSQDSLSQDKLERLTLARQLALLSPPTINSVFALPVWAFAMLWITSGAFPSMGASPFMAAVLWFAGVCVVCALAYFIDRAYRQARLVDATFDPQAWMGRYTAALALLSSSWASLIWVFWIPGNQINQMALALFVIAGIMNGVVARINRFQCYLYGSGTAFLIMWLHFLVEKSDTASIFSIVLPLLFLAIVLILVAHSVSSFRRDTTHN